MCAYDLRQVLEEICWSFTKDHIEHLLNKLLRIEPVNFTLDAVSLTKRLSSVSASGTSSSMVGMVSVCSFHVPFAASG
jgi:hypothetical protein